MGNIRFTSHIKQWVNEAEKKIDGTVLVMATDIHRVSAILAPKDSRTLVKSGRINRKGLGHYEVSYGGSAVPYARRRHFENKKNPQTLGYLAKAGDSVVRNAKRYTGKL